MQKYRIRHAVSFHNRISRARLFKENQDAFSKAFPGYGKLKTFHVTGGMPTAKPGFLLNNEMDDFSAKPGVVNSYGVTGGEANAIAPRKRMLSSMSPTLVYLGERLWLVLGTPGGPTIFTSVFQVIVNRRDFGMVLEDAVAAPRFHHQWPPPLPMVDPILVEKLPDEETLKRLKAFGYTLIPRRSIGNVQAIEVQDTRVIGVSDPRGIGVAAYE